MNTKKFAALFSVILALLVMLSVSVFADGEDTAPAEDAVLLAASDETAASAETAASDETGDGEMVILGAEDGEDVAAEDGEEAVKEDEAEELDGAAIPTVGATDDTGAEAVTVDEQAAAEAADSVLDGITTAADEPAETEPATGTWDNLGTSGLIGIIVAVVLCIAIIVVIVVLIPKKPSQKK